MVTPKKAVAFIRKRIEFWWRMWYIGYYHVYPDIEPSVFDIHASARSYGSGLKLRRLNDSRAAAIWRNMNEQIKSNNFPGIDASASAMYRLVRGYRVYIPNLKIPKFKSTADPPKPGNVAPKQVPGWKRCILVDESYAGVIIPAHYNIDWSKCKVYEGYARKKSVYYYDSTLPHDVRTRAPLLMPIPEPIEEGAPPPPPPEEKPEEEEPEEEEKEEEREEPEEGEGEPEKPEPAPGEPTPAPKPEPDEKGEEGEIMRPVPIEDPNAPKDGEPSLEDMVKHRFIPTPSDVEPNHYGAARLKVRYFDISGDPFTLGYSGHMWMTPPKIGEILHVSSISDSEITQFIERLPPTHRGMRPWDTKMCLKVWRQGHKADWVIAHWYEMAYVRYRIKKILHDRSAGGIRDNAEEFGRYAPLVFSKWGDLPVKVDDVAIELYMGEDGERCRLVFPSIWNQPDGLTGGMFINAQVQELREMPVKYVRSTVYDRYRPRMRIVSDKPPMNDWLWDAMILETGMTMDKLMPEELRTFNEYMVDKINTEIFAKFVRPTEMGAAKRKFGKYVRKRGLEPTDKKPLIAASLASFGFLFWGSKHGYHREFTYQKGKRYGKTGVMNIVWANGSSSKNGDYFGWKYEAYYRIYSTILSLVKMNEEQGNYLNFYVGMSELQDDNCFPQEVPNIKFWHRDMRGNIAGYPGSGRDTTEGFNPFAEWSVPSGGVRNPDIADFVTRQKKVETATQKYYGSMVLCPQHNVDLEKREGRHYCPVGRHYPATIIKTETCNLCYHIRAERALKAGALIDTLLKLKPVQTNDTTKEPSAFQLLNENQAGRGKDVRGTTILLTQHSWIRRIEDGAFFIQELDKWSDIVIIDMGARDWSMLFHYDPDLLRRPKWICTKCNYSRPYKKWEYMNNFDYPPHHHKEPMKIVGEPICTYIYVGSDVENLPYYVLKAMKGKLDALADIDFD